LKRSEIGTDGKIDNTCNISKAYNELNKRLKITKDDKKPFKTFRATGSTTIDNNKEYSKFANHYLADAPKSIMAKHYIAHIEDRQEDFDKAIDWLGKQFDIA